MTTDDFHALCAEHDWHYARSDNYGVYEKGKARDTLLRQFADHKPEYAEIVKAWREWANGDGPHPLEEKAA